MAARARVIWAASALDELDEIAAYIALDNRAAGRALVQRATDATDRLRDNPDSGRWVPEIENKIYRELLVAPCRIIYRRDGAKIYIVHVTRQERVLRTSRLF